MKKPDVITSTEVFFDYYYMQMIEEQKKTNKLLQQLLNQKEGTQNVKRSISKT
jgi:predicted outer membrane protein